MNAVVLYYIYETKVQMTASLLCQEVDVSFLPKKLRLKAKENKRKASLSASLLLLPAF